MSLCIVNRGSTSINIPVKDLPSTLTLSCSRLEKNRLDQPQPFLCLATEVSGSIHSQRYLAHVATQFQIEDIFQIESVTFSVLPPVENNCAWVAF